MVGRKGGWVHSGVDRVGSTIGRTGWPDTDTPGILFEDIGKKFPLRCPFGTSPLVTLVNGNLKPDMNHSTTAIPTSFSGGCACESVRYEATGDSIIMLHCHCRDCQRSSGGPFASFVVMPKEAFHLSQGSLRFHATPSEMGGLTHRGFCADCGSPIVGKPDAVAHLVAIRAASLDDPSWFVPQIDVWTSDAHPWHPMNSALPKFEKYPPAGE